MTASTGRIKEYLRPELRTRLFGENVDHEIAVGLRESLSVDTAHVVMLAEQGLLQPATAASLLRSIDVLAADGGAELQGRHAPRGLYLLYEAELDRIGGPGVGAVLQLGRSRNDHSATTYRLRLRAPYLSLMRASVALLETIGAAAARYDQTPLLAYTHGQPAVPSTLGHYFAAIGCAVARDLVWLEQSFSALDESPLGAAAGGGTSVPILRSRTSALLGFVREVSNSVDAVASRDFVLHIGAAATSTATTLSRLATDLFAWMSEEFDYLSLPDDLVSSSSAMPQKRNPFLLEHVKGLAGMIAGYFPAAAAAMQGTPFANSVAVGTQAADGLWQTLARLETLLALVEPVIAEATPNVQRMNARLEASYATAMYMTERLALAGHSFRASHHLVGEAVSQAVDAGTGPRGAAALVAAASGLEPRTLELDPARPWMAGAFGAGAGDPERWAAHERVAQAAAALARAAATRAARWETADSELRDAVTNITNQSPGG